MEVGLYTQVSTKLGWVQWKFYYLLALNIHMTTYNIHIPTQSKHFLFRSINVMHIQDGMLIIHVMHMQVM